MRPGASPSPSPSVIEGMDHLPTTEAARHRPRCRAHRGLAAFRDVTAAVVRTASHHRGPLISHLLADACRRDSQRRRPMLSAIVILKATGRPAVGQFFEPVERGPIQPDGRGPDLVARTRPRPECPVLSLLAVTGA